MHGGLLSKGCEDASDDAERHLRAMGVEGAAARLEAIAQRATLGREAAGGDVWFNQNPINTPAARFSAIRLGIRPLWSRCMAVLHSECGATDPAGFVTAVASNRCSCGGLGSASYRWPRPVHTRRSPQRRQERRLARCIASRPGPGVGSIVVDRCLDATSGFVYERCD